VRWHNVSSDSFHINNGTRQGGILSPILYIRCIRELLQAIIYWYSCWLQYWWLNDECLGLRRRHCPSGTLFLGCYMQTLLDVLDDNICLIDMSCNSSRTVCMVFNPVCRQKVVCDTFHASILSGQNLQFVVWNKMIYLSIYLSITCFISSPSVLLCST
jgi:hypothetical protein